MRKFGKKLDNEEDTVNGAIKGAAKKKGDVLNQRL
jgi:hypothetical protein